VPHSTALPLSLSLRAAATGKPAAPVCPRLRQGRQAGRQAGNTLLLLLLPPQQPASILRSRAPVVRPHVDDARVWMRMRMWAVCCAVYRRLQPLRTFT